MLPRDEKLAHLLARECQVRGAHLDERSGGPRAPERQRRVDPADQDQSDVGRQMGDRVLERVPAGVARHHVGSSSTITSGATKRRRAVQELVHRLVDGGRRSCSAAATRCARVLPVRGRPPSRRTSTSAQASLSAASSVTQASAASDARAPRPEQPSSCRSRQELRRGRASRVGHRRAPSGSAVGRRGYAARSGQGASPRQAGATRPRRSRFVFIRRFSCLICTIGCILQPGYVPHIRPFYGSPVNEPQAPRIGHCLRRHAFRCSFTRVKPPSRVEHDAARF